MLKADTRPKVIGIPPGADTAEILAGRIAFWRRSAPVQDIARLQILTNTRRLARKLHARLSDEPVALLPRIDVLTDATALAPLADLGLPRSRLEAALELQPLVRAILQAAPERAPPSAATGLAMSLIDLAEEMAGEGASFAALKGLREEAGSAFFQQGAELLALLAEVLEGSATSGEEERRRRAVAATLAGWDRHPPMDPVLVVGSTGSRRTTADLMAAVARLPRGAVVLPGFDFDMPAALFDALGPEDEGHPQYRLARLLQRLGLSKNDVERWGDTPDPPRARLMSMALRPAPVTNDWRRDAPVLGDLRAATSHVTLLVSPSERAEAAAIALAMRAAVAEGKSVSLVTPDRVIARRVSAALGRWNLRADDSSGAPLALTPVGRLARLLLDLLRHGPRIQTLLGILKHPLCASGKGARGPHLLLARKLELFLRRMGRPEIDLDLLKDFAGREGSEGAAQLADWLHSILAQPIDGEEWAKDLARLLETIVAGPGGAEAPRLWSRRDGDALDALLTELGRLGAKTRVLDRDERFDLLEFEMARIDVRDERPVHPGVSIMGTLESRGQASDVTILAGLVEGTWPAAPVPDPWLSRTMRARLGLFLPERETGLAAHDFQQAACGPQVILSRAVRNARAETVPSRWLSRVTMLLEGLPEQNGPAALAEMTERGDALLAAQRRLEVPETKMSPATRPAPMAPPAIRPRTLSVTRIQTLIRDPYAIYARYILGLRRLDPLRPRPDARVKGILFHAIFETAVREGKAQDPGAVLGIAQEVLSRLPWPVESEAWLADLRVIASEFAAREKTLGERVRSWTEVVGRLDLPEGFTITGKADRIDLLAEGRLVIEDWKTGKAPSRKEMIHFDRQLPIEALMAEGGGFAGVPAAEVAEFGHVELKRKFAERSHTLPDDELGTAATLAGLSRLLTTYADADTGYASRRAMEKVAWPGDYDHLARFGEWGPTDRAVKRRMP